MAKPLDLDHIAAIDQHCHPWRRMDAPFTADAYRTLFTEGGEQGAGEGRQRHNLLPLDHAPTCPGAGLQAG